MMTRALLNGRRTTRRDIIAGAAAFVLCQSTLLAQPAATSEPVLSQILATSSYDYAPAGVFDGRWHMLFTSGVVAGDHIMYVSSVSPRHGWSSPKIAFGPSWNPFQFDGAHTADGAILWHGDAFYLYYTGFPLALSTRPLTSAVGVVSSHRPDSFSRPWKHEPVVTAHNFPAFRNNPSRNYGAGQPSAVSQGGYVYLFWTDSTAPASDANGGGLYVIRSTDPMFRGAVEELTATGFQRRGNTASLTRTYSLWPVISGDVEYVATTKQWILAVNGIHGKTSFVVFEENFRNPQIVEANGVSWTEGPGLFRQWHGHALPHGSGNPNLTSLIWGYPGGTPNQPFTYDLWLGGMDVRLR